MPLEFETMTAAGKFSDACELPILDLRPLMPDEVLANIPRYFNRWEDGTTQRILLDDNYGETAAAGTCDFVTFTSETLECEVVIPNQQRLAAGVDDVDYEQFMIEFCKANSIMRFPTVFRADGSFDVGAPLSDRFLEYILADLRRRYMQALRVRAWTGDQANANEFSGILTQIDAGPQSSGDACEPYEMVEFNWSTMTGTGGTTPTVPSATIDAASDSVTIHGFDFDGMEGLNMVEFLVLWLERLMEHDLAPWADSEIEFELWVGRGQTTAIANLAACMQPCEGCVNPLSDPQIRARASEFRRDRVIWLYPYDNISITLRQSPELSNQMFLVPKTIGGRPLIGWVFRDQARQVAILNGSMPYYGAEGGTLPDEHVLYPTDDVDAASRFELRGFSVNVQKNGNCIDYWINSESAIVIQGWPLWLRFTQVDSAGLVPDQVSDDMGILATGCTDPGGNNMELTVVALEAYGTVEAGDTYVIYGEDGVSAIIGTVVSYVEGTDVLTVDLGADFDCTWGGGLAAATVVKLAENSP